MRSILLSAGLLLVVGPAWAGDDRLDVPRDKWLSPTEIIEKLSGQGYKVIEIESDDGAYEVEMVDKRNDTKIEIHVHPVTGELLPDYDD